MSLLHAPKSDKCIEEQKGKCMMLDNSIVFLSVIIDIVVTK